MDQLCETSKKVTKLLEQLKKGEKAKIIDTSSVDRLVDAVYLI